MSSADDSDPKLGATGEGLRTAEAQFSIHRDNMIKAYDGLLKMLTALDRTDPKVKEKHRETASMIVENMAKSLKVWHKVLHGSPKFRTSADSDIHAGSDASNKNSDS